MSLVTHRLRVIEAAIWLLLGRLAVLLPFPMWRRTLFGTAAGNRALPQSELQLAQACAGAVRSADARLPIKLKCLTRAAALQWMLRCRGIPAVITIGAGPATAESRGPALHAWLDAGGSTLIGGREKAQHVPLMVLARR